MTVVAIKSLKLDKESMNMIQKFLSEFFPILTTTLKACNLYVITLALPGSLTWALRPLNVAAAANLFSVLIHHYIYDQDNYFSTEHIVILKRIIITKIWV